MWILGSVYVGMDKAVRLSLAEAGNRYTSSKRETDRLIKKEI